MFEDFKSSYGKFILDKFEFECGCVLNDVQVEYVTRGTPKYDENGEIVNAVVYSHRFNGNYASIDDFVQFIQQVDMADFEFFYVSISSLGFPESCSPSTTNLKFNFPKYTIKDSVNFKRKFLEEKFGIKKILGVFGVGMGGYDAFTWACEYPDEMEFLVVAGSSFKTNSYRYIASKVIDSIINSSDAYYDDVYNESVSRIMVSINILIYSQYFSKKIFQKLSRDEIDILMEDFVDEGLFVDIHDFKYRNDVVLDYDVEDKLQNIKAKTLIFSSTDDIYYTPEFDVHPLKDKIENITIFMFESQDVVLSNDYSIFTDVIHEFFDEFKK